jgi:hypothetical protein
MHATTSLVEAGSEDLTSSGPVKTRYVKFWRSGLVGVRFGVRGDHSAS